MLIYVKAIIGNARLLFSELASHLIPLVHSYANIAQLVAQCDVMSVKLNPLAPIGSILTPPCMCLLLYSLYLLFLLPLLTFQGI